MNHRVEVLVRGPKAPQHRTKRVGLSGERLGPAPCKLDARDGIVAAANADTVGVALLILVWLGLSIARVFALTCAHGASL